MWKVNFFPSNSEELFEEHHGTQWRSEAEAKAAVSPGGTFLVGDTFRLERHIEFNPIMKCNNIE